jgi:hypothetical protein
MDLDDLTVITYCTPLSFKEWGRLYPRLCQQGRFPGKVQPDNEGLGTNVGKRLDPLQQKEPRHQGLRLHLQC